MIPSQFFRAYSPGLCYRALSETVLWLPVPEIVLTLERLSKNWQRMIKSKELWVALILRDIDDVDINVTACFPNLRVAYRTLFVRKNYLYFWKAKENSIAVFNPANDSMKTIHSSSLQDLDCTSSFLVLKDGRLLVCGGRGGVVMGVMMYLRSTFLVDMHAVSVERKRDMRERKMGMELVELSGYVYCFGGHNMRKLVTIERCCTSAFSWDRYGEMAQAEDQISAVTAWEKVFLACKPSLKLLVYDPLQQIFTTRALLPAVFVKGLSILNGTDWILFQDAKSAVVIDLATNTHRTSAIVGDFQLDLNGAYGVRQRHRVYFVSHDPDREIQGVFEFDLRAFRMASSRVFPPY